MKFPDKALEVTHVSPVDRETGTCNVTVRIRARYFLAPVLRAMVHDLREAGLLWSPVAWARCLWAFAGFVWELRGTL